MTLRPYDPKSFPPVAVTVDVVLLTLRAGTLSVLLVERGEDPFRGRWALPGGFVEPSEGLDEAAARELKEETGLHVLPEAAHIEQLRSYGAPNRDPRMRIVSVAYLGLLPELEAPVAGGDVEAVRFWAVDDVLDSGDEDRPELGFDHELILRDGLERARAKLEYTPLAAAFCEEPFTLADLRRVYEAVWGVQLDASNFRRKVLGSDGFVEPTGERLEGRPGPRPELYRRGAAALLHPPMLQPGKEH